MDKLKALIAKKPPLLVAVSIGYLAVIGLIKWWIHPPLMAVWYLVGGLVGVYFLDAAELFFSLTPSPFRSILFAALFAIVSFFVVTSSGSLIAAGLVLSLYVELLLWQIGEWEVTHTFTSWYRMVAVPVDASTKQWIFLGFLAVFIVESILFIR